MNIGRAIKIESREDYYRITNEILNRYMQNGEIGLTYKTGTSYKTGLGSLAVGMNYKADKDTVTIGSTAIDNNVGIYNRPSSGPLIDLRLDQSEPIKYLGEIKPASEKGYTEQDALRNQYLKQFRLDYTIGDEYATQNGSRTIKLALDYGDEELEAFRQKLCLEGLGTEIDWRGVESDFASISLGGSDPIHMEVDYLASRYVVLKDRIQTQYVGDEQAAQMEKLNQLYQKTKERMADSYATTVGGYYEEFGEEGISEEFRASILALVDEKTDVYEAYLAQAGDYAKISNPEDTWLLQDDGFMAAQLRESYAAEESSAGTADKSETESGTYSVEDLMFLGQYAIELKKQVLYTGGWSTSSAKYDPDSELGKALAAEKQYIQELADRTGISSKADELVNRVFQPFIDKYLDALDKEIDTNRKREYPWLYRTTYIDRAAVYSSYQSALDVN